MVDPAKEMARLDYALGQIHALTSFTMATIGSHSDPQLLQRHFELVSQAALARTESVLVSEAFLDGQRSVVDRPTDLLRHASADLADRNTS
jgi:hypothetical protein